MNDEPRRTKGWPLFAIVVLILLLCGFLYFQWRNRKEGPAVVKEAPVDIREAPVGVPAPPTRPGEPSPSPTPAPSQNVPAAVAEFDQRLKEAQKALADKKWEEAEKALAAARALKAEAAELKALAAQLAEERKKEEAAAAEEARKAELRKRQDKEFAALRDKLEEDRRQDLWDSAHQSLEKFLKDYPSAAQDAQYLQLSRQINGFRNEAEKLFQKALDDAQKQFNEGLHAQAIATAEKALTYFPERKAAVREFQERARVLQFEKGMVRIPSATCWVGSDQGDEKPFQSVKLEPFLIDKHEVTNEEYLAFISATGHAAPPYWQGRKIPKGRERHPVVFVTFEDAQAYAQWAGKRLPTAQEWEVAARGPDKREYPWGNSFVEKENVFLANCLEYWQLVKTNPGTVPVDDKTFANGESAFGVYGMGGNVWEWTATAAPPKNGSKGGEFRVLKGGSFMTPKGALRCANVYADDPRLAHPDVGFRCARDLK